MKNQFHPKYQRKYFWISALKFFVAFWGLPGSFLGFQQPSLFMILLSPQEAQRASRKPPGSYKKFQGRNPEIFSLVFWMKLIFHKDILKLTDLQKMRNYILFTYVVLFLVTHSLQGNKMFSKLLFLSLIIWFFFAFSGPE